MNLRQLLLFARPYRWNLLAVVMLTMASSLAMLAVPAFAGQILGDIVNGASRGQGRVAALLVMCLAATAGINFATAYQTTTTSARLLSDLRRRVFEHVQQLPLRFHDNRSKGDTLALMTVEISRLSNFLTGTLSATPSRLMTTIGAVFLMFRIDTRLALIVPLLVPVFYLSLKIVGRKLRRLGEAWQRSEAQVVSLAEEALDMLPATKAYTRERRQTQRYMSAIQTTARIAIREGKIYAALEPLLGLIAALSALMILLLAGQSVKSGEMNAAELFSFIFYAALLTRPVGSLAHLYGQLQTTRGILARLQAVLDEPPETGPIESILISRARGDICFENIHFGYPDRGPLLCGVNLHIAAGQKVALLGSNGAGKTAIINLLMRYYLPVMGSIVLDGTDVSTLPLGYVRRQIGLVPQSVFLFNGTIRENIAFGADSPDQDRIESAVCLAQARDFIDALPDKMATRIGDRGLRLSGGQRQRIALARALINDPPILIFDEATSMFDEEGEAAFIRACSKALQNRTVIMVTHRPATLALADRVLVLENGQVTEPAAGVAHSGTTRVGCDN